MGNFSHESFLHKRLLKRRLRTMSDKLFILLLILLTCAAANGRISVFVLEGDNVTLSCASKTPDQLSCDGIRWTCYENIDEGPKVLVNGTEFKNDVDVKRLSLEPDCSLVIKEAKTEDNGRYFCELENEKESYSKDNERSLIVVRLTRVENRSNVTLTCEIFTPCISPKKVEWLFDGQEEKTTSTNCKPAVAHFPSSSNLNKARASCEVSEGNNTHKFHFRPADVHGDGRYTPLNLWTSFPVVTATTTIAPSTNKSAGGWWVYAAAAAAPLTLLVLVVSLAKWRRSKGKRTKVDDVLTSNLTAGPADPAQADHNPDDPGHEPGYTSVFYKKDSNKVEGHVYDEVRSETSRPNVCTIYATVDKVSQ